jgi:catechol 2,3-dioxygenase-like lactoylglutathione lyase family enzyme
MKTLGLSWLGVRTEHFGETVDLFTAVFGLEVEYEDDMLTSLEMADGSLLEIIKQEDTAHADFGAAPVPGFFVEDTDAARGELEERGIAFLGATKHTASGWSYALFRGPDGNLYRVMTPPRER